MATSTVRMGGWAGAAVALAGAGWLSAASGQDGPPPPPPPPGDVRGAADDLDLSADRRAKVDPLLADLQLQQRKARDGRPDQHHDGDGGDAKPATPPATPPPLAAGERRVAMAFAGGHDTDGRDGGRPVVLVAAGMGVPADVFRETFTRVHPSGPSRGPTDAEARANKRALLDGLSKYGVTDDQINAVSNYYRYVRSRGQTWRHRAAVASAIVLGGRVVRFEVSEPGAGYTTPPTVRVEGMPNVAATVTLTFGTDLATNGSVRQIAVRTDVPAP